MRPAVCGRHRGASTPLSQLATIAAAYVIFCTLYLAAAAWPLGAPVSLAPSALDEAIPFLPWTVWLYLSQFAFLGFLFWQASGTVAWSRNLRGMLVATIVSVVVFVVYPTRIPRAPVDADPVSTFGFGLIYGTDPATNCLPSLHVSLACLGSTGFWPERRPLAVGCLAWATVIAASTLTTKQHYVVDVLAGGLVALGAGWLTRRLESA